MTHATIGNGTVSKHLVTPADEDIPVDFQRAIAALGIKVHHFRLQGTGRKRTVVLE